MKVRFQYDGNSPEKYSWAFGIMSRRPDSLYFIKKGRIKNTAIVEHSPWGKMFLYEYRWDLKRIVLSPFRRSGPARIWKYSVALRDIGVAQIQPVFWIEKKRFVFTFHTILGFRFEESRTLCHHLNNQSPETVFSLLRRVTDAISTLHSSGFLHKDLKWNNICVRDDDIGKIVFIDLEKIRRCRSAILLAFDFARFILDGIVREIPEPWIEPLVDRYLEQRFGQVKPSVKRMIRIRLLQKRKKYVLKRKHYAPIQMKGPVPDTGRYPSEEKLPYRLKSME